MLSSFEESLSLIKKSEVRISEHRIGQGSFGDIYQGIYKGGRVAVKVLRAKKRTNRNLRLLQEEGIHLMKLKQHPNVCRFIGMIHEENITAVITQFVRNGSVKECMQRGRSFSLDQKLNILLQSSAGVWSLHDQGIIHRDIALRNMLINLKDFSVYVSDFGLSRSLSRDFSNNEESLPVAWSSPETLQDGSYSRKTDIWSFGVMIWELFSEETPFSDTGFSLVKLMYEIMDGRRLETQPNWGASICRLMSDCWSEEPEHRPTMIQVYARFEEFYRPHEITPSHTPSPFFRHSDRSPLQVPKAERASSDFGDMIGSFGEGKSRTV